MIEPLEKTDPDLAAQFMAIARGQYRPRVRIFGTRVYTRSPITGATWTEITLDIKRNDPCICGSGKKYKKCCLNLEA